MNMMRVILAGVIAVILFAVSCSDGRKSSSLNSVKGKKVFYLDSYHTGYEPNVPSRNVIDATLLSKGIIIKEFYMNTKFENTPEKISSASSKAVKEIQNFLPDLIIAADDPALDYVICPFFAGSKTPVVFTGANWQAPACTVNNPGITGQIEVEFIVELIDFLGTYSGSDRLFFLQGGTETDRESLDYYTNKLGIKPYKSVFVSDFDSWKKAYSHFQEMPGIVILRNNSGIRNWKNSEAADFVRKVTKNPSGSVSAHMKQFCLVSYAKDKYEFGEYASATAVDILRGGKSFPLPFEKNMRMKKILNMKLALRLGIIFPMDAIDDAEFAEEYDE